MHTDIDTAKLIQSLATANVTPIVTPIVAGSSTHLLVPQGYDLKNIDSAIQQAQPGPARKTGTLSLLDLASFLTYTAEQQCQATGYILADPDRATIVAVFNDHRSTTPGWRDHKASYTAEKTPEFLRWMAMNGKPFAQAEFAEFIEDNMADIPGDEGPALLKMATTIAATTSINFSSAKRLQDGQTQLTYSETIDANAGAGGELKIPQTFNIGVRIFKNGDGYAIKARLKYRLAGGAVKFWYELDRPERALENAFNGYVEKLREQSTYTVLLGKSS